MKTLITLAATVLLLLFLAAAPAYPQDDTKPAAQENKDQDKNQQPDKEKDKDKAAKPDKGGKAGEARPGQDQPGARPEDRKDDRTGDQKNNDRTNNNEMRRQNDNRQPEASHPQEQHPTQDMGHGDQQHQAQRGKHIPDDKFRGSFGRQHAFHVQRTQVVNVSQPVVVYGGYSFQLVDAWPVDWGFDDDVYIDYVDDGYYLFDPMHPGIRIAVFVAE